MKQLILLILVSSCAHRSHQNPIQVEKDKYEKVSVQTALDLAFTSYLKSCSLLSKEFGRDNYFDDCKKRAKQHVKNDILFILEQ